MKQTTAAALVVAGAVTAGCGEYVRDQGRSPSQVVITRLTAGEDSEATLRSDVIRMVTTPAPCSETSPCPTVFNDTGTVQMALMLKDPGSPTAPAAPSQINYVTFTRYRVSYRRTDGRNTPGVDVPYAFDSAATFTINESGGTSDFQIVRHSAKEESPLRALTSSNAIISTIAEVTFFGRDQAGNEVTATGNIGVDFGNFADSN